MKLLLCLFLLLLSTPALASLNYELDISLQPEQHQLVATARIDLENEPLPPLKLQLSPRCEIIAVRQEDNPVPYTFSSGTLQLLPDGSGPISISYRGVFDDRVPDTPSNIEDPSYGVAATISTAGSYLSSAVNWYPRLPVADSNYSISISAPIGTEAVTSGRRLERKEVNGRSISIWQIDYPLEGLTLAAGAYQVFEDTHGPVPIYAYFSADNAALATTYLQAARSYLELYIGLFGPYPFHKFAIVENFFPTGYGLPSWTLLGSSVIRLPFIVRTSLGHEIAHSWWGNGVKVNYAGGNWCEGLTTYVADYLYKERSSPAEAREYRQNILRDYANLVTPENNFAVNRFSSRHDKASQVIGYGKTTLIFHMLRKKVGDRIFWEGLRQIAQQRMHNRVGWDDFRELFSRLSGQDLHPFFNQWLTRTAGPQLALEDVELTQTEQGWQISGQLTQQTLIYQVEVELELTSESGVQLQQLHLDTVTKSFRFETNSHPLNLKADPEADLFRILAREEIPATVNSIRGSDRLLVLRAEKYVPNSEAISVLLGGLRKAELPIRNLSEIDPGELAHHDLLIFGLPDQLRPPHLLETSTGQFSLGDQQFDPRQQSAFIVIPNPLNAERSLAWFITEDPQAGLVARKIPHYGKYSELLFNGLENGLKEVRTPDKSPLKLNLTKG